MEFAMDFAYASQDVIDMLTQSLCLPDTPWPKRLARLYCLSDILYNSNASVSNAASYRGLIQASLKDVFMAVHQAMVSQPTRLRQNVVIDKVSLHHLLLHSFDHTLIFVSSVR